MMELECSCGSKDFTVEVELGKDDDNAIYVKIFCSECQNKVREFKEASD